MSLGKKKGSAFQKRSNSWVRKAIRAVKVRKSSLSPLDPLKELKKALLVRSLSSVTAFSYQQPGKRRPGFSRTRN